ncbi:MAG: hydantoinase/oxoprolinase family protein [Candidatus Dormibacteraceae bacterium]
MGKYAVAVDIGGTFTDLVAASEDGKVVTGKALTTPGHLSTGVLQVLDQATQSGAEVEFFVHGTTAGLNALLEHRYAPIGLLTTKGFRDVYEIGRANRPAMYDLHYHRPAPLVPRRHRLEVVERMSPAGHVVTPLDEDSVTKAADHLVRDGVESVAIVFLHSYRNPAHELRAEQIVTARHPQLSVSLSHRIANEWREYERTSTTVVNAAIAPTVRSYLAELRDRLGERGVTASVHIMQSNGGMTTAARAREQPVNTLLSGPVGGAIAAANLARRAGSSSAIAIDMGGTSFDVSLCIDGKPTIAREAMLEGQPLILPVIDVETIGAGGGSVAWESAGGLRVGPRSAGAEPGPACYGRAGTEPTVTDANVHLGRVNPRYFLGGRMALHPQLAADALGRLAQPLGLDQDQLAEGILDVINARMAGLIRQITIGRGLDPRQFSLVAFGGAGPMHAVFLAEELGIDTVLVPHSPGTFSAHGMLEAEIRHDLVHPYFARWDRMDRKQVFDATALLAASAKQLLQEDGIDSSKAALTTNVDLRYVGQEHFLTLPAAKFDDAVLKRFHRLYKKTFGHSNPDELVEVVNLRLTAVGTGAHARPNGSHPESGSGEAYDRYPVRFRGIARPTPRFRRQDLRIGQEVKAPCIVDEESCTTVVPEGWSVTSEAKGWLAIRRER